MSMPVTPEDSSATTPSPPPLSVEAEAPSPSPPPSTLGPSASPPIPVVLSPPPTNLASPPPPIPVTPPPPVSSHPAPPNPVLSPPPPIPVTPPPPVSSQPAPPNPVLSPPPPVTSPPPPSPVFSPPPTRSPILSPPPVSLPAPPPPATLTPPPPVSPPSHLQPPPIPPVLSPQPVSLPAPPPPAILTPPPPVSSPSPLQPLPTPPETSPPPAVTPPPPLLSPQPPTTSPPNLTSPPPPATSPPPLVSPPPQTLPSTPKPPTSRPIMNGSPHVMSGHSHISTALVIGCAFAAVVLLLLCWKICICWRSKRRRNHGSSKHERRFPDLAPKDKPYGGLSNGMHVITVLPTPSAPPLPSNIENSGCVTYKNGLLHQARDPTLGSSCAAFTYDELVVATNGFSESNLLGEGGFGYVHRGVIPSGKFVAIKQLKDDSHQGEREFRAEVEIISRVHHKHLVSLVGYCIAGPQRLLVYEFVPNNNLEFHLHGNMCPVMEWATRLKIVIGAAKGLAYLHEDCNPTIIHRDVKAANILLDHNFEAKVSDFGLAKTFSTTNTIITHISTRVVGTFGYLAPEYALSGRLTVKSDVYSFGVMLIELITGRPPISATESEMNQGLVSWARPLLAQALEDGNFDALVDPRLGYNYNTNELASMVVCAAACVQQSSLLRPKMSQVVRTLEGEIPLNDLSGPNTLMQKTSFTSWGSDTGLQYKNIKELNKELERQEHGFTMYSGTTSEYGLNPSISSTDTQQHHVRTAEQA
ncbi:proline-rich receptor-like protein kinase PERK1 [Tripterygium wilfordii]|uniref:non-specific serine/threonine protein kinase n=1 Tax=Tripterygium wilfordii TaxID=458696 RepID=A0A7J7DPH4_TRIWF|nr:proline-rich receptor-like protein kinase PERK1 [Tripterygium wilfordii]KAF5748245.1 proline-rich receptor-like protein kinase PERK1 [Tripterygium wilfordii]